MSEPSNASKPRPTRLHQYTAELRRLVFNKLVDAARYFKLNHGNISHYENGDDIPPLGYLAGLAWLADERDAQAGRFDSSRRELYLRNMKRIIFKYYKREQPFLDWDELTLAAEQFMQSRWGDNWSLEIARRFPKSPLGNLPSVKKEYLGYQQEIENILQWLTSDDVQLICIEGVEGIGKTWLASEVGNRCLTSTSLLLEASIWISAQDYPTQTRWLESVLNTVARQLRFPDLVHLPLTERRARVSALLRRRHVLLIIDNFNTMEDPDLEDWLRQMAEKTKVIITSRYTPNTLLSARTRSIRLPGLTTPNALALIRFHARNIRLPELASATDEALMPLVEAAAGNPLIIRGAVGNYKYIGDFKQAVEYTIEKKIWEPKWGILTTGARQVLIVTPFFAESMSNEALGMVAGVKGNHLYEALEQLEKIQLLNIYESQLQQRVQIRYSIHPTVRSFATSKLKSLPALEEQARARWVTYFINFARHHLVRADLQERYWNALGGVEFAPIDREWSNTKEVLRWLDEQGQDQMLVDLMMMLVHYMDSHALFPERIEYAEKAAKAAQRLGQKLEEAYFRIDGLGWILIKERRFEEVFQQIETSLNLAQSMDLSPNDANNLITLAHAFRAQAYLEQGKAAQASEELAQVLTADCSPIIRSRVGTVAGDIAVKEENYPKAIQHYKAAIDALQQVGVGYESSSLHYRLGFAYLAVEDIVHAEAAFNELLTNHPLDVTIGVVSAEYGLARTAQQKGEISKAQTLAHQAYQQLSELDADHELLKEIEEFLDVLSPRLI